MTTAEIREQQKQMIATGDYAERIELAAQRLTGVIAREMDPDDIESRSIARELLAIFSDLVTLIERIEE